MRTFIISPATHWYALRHLFYSVMTLGVVLVLTGAYALPGDLLLLVFMPYVVLTLFVHAEYYLRNRHTTVAAFADRLEVTTREGATVVLPYLDMEAVELHAAGGVYRQIDWENYSFQSYHYLKIRCHGQTHYLTSLLVKRPLEQAFPQLLVATAGRYTRRHRMVAYTD